MPSSRDPAPMQESGPHARVPGGDLATLIRLWKPYGFLSQFTSRDARPTLKSLLPVPGVYPAGRLDRDSEGLLLLTDSGDLQARISRPGGRFTKTYRVLVEGAPAPEALARLCAGITLKDGPARALAATVVAAPEVPERDPPPQPRPGRPTSWLESRIDEGRNRQIRRMCAAIGCPVLRLIRTEIGPWTLAGLEPGTWQQETLHAPVSPRGAPSSRPPHDRRSGTRSSANRPRTPRASRTRRGS